MRLLLDENLTGAVAQQLRSRGHDVTAVVERAALRGLPDSTIAEIATAERRAIVTVNVRDYRRLRPAYGLVCIPWRSPTAQGATGMLVRALDRLLREHPGDAPLELWLR